MKTQQQRIEMMKAEVERIGGVITTMPSEPPLPPDIEEEFLRQVLRHPDRGLLLRVERGFAESGAQ